MKFIDCVVRRWMPKMVFWIRRKMKVSFKLDIHIEIVDKEVRLDSMRCINCQLHDDSPIVGRTVEVAKYTVYVTLRSLF